MLSELGKRDYASLTGLALIFARDTDKKRYVVQQLKIEIVSRYYIFYDVSL